MSILPIPSPKKKVKRTFLLGVQELEKVLQSLSFVRNDLHGLRTVEPKWEGVGSLFCELLDVLLESFLRP